MIIIINNKVKEFFLFNVIGFVNGCDILNKNKCSSLDGDIVMVMEGPYIKNFQIIRDHYATYETQKMYFDNNIKLSNMALILIILFPIFYTVTMIIIGLSFNLSSSVIADMFFIGIFVFVFFGILIACLDYQKSIQIHLFLDQKNDKIALTIGAKESVFYQPKQIHIAIHEYPIYSRNGHYQSIVLIVLGFMNHHQNLNLNDFEKLRFASIQYKSVLEAKMIYSEVVHKFSPLLMCLNLPMTHEKEVIKYDSYFYLK